MREYIHVATHYITHMPSHTTDIMRITTHFPFDMGGYEEMSLSMIGENRQLVTNEPVEFEK